MLIKSARQRHKVSSLHERSLASNLHTGRGPVSVHLHNSHSNESYAARLAKTNSQVKHCPPYTACLSSLRIYPKPFMLKNLRINDLFVGSISISSLKCHISTSVSPFPITSRPSFKAFHYVARDAPIFALYNINCANRSHHSIRTPVRV